MNINDGLHNRLLRCTQSSNHSVNDIVLDAIGHEVARQDWRKRLAQCPKTDIGEEWSIRDTELGKRSSLHDH